jgi:putative hemolysin
MFFWNFILIFVLVALNGFFVAVEFAVVASRRTRIELLAEDGNHAAAIVKTWLEKPTARDRLIAAAQLGITIVSLALGAVGENTFEALLEPLFHDLALSDSLRSLTPVLAGLPLVLSLIIVTSFHVVLGEQVPKVATLHAPERIAILAAQPMQIFAKVFKWFVDILDWATRQILKLFGLRAFAGHSVLYTVDELKQIVAESAEGGVIETPDREMLNAIFDISELFVRQVMIPRTEILAIEADAYLPESIQIATQSTYTKFPVYENDLDNIIGVVNIRDLLRAQQDPRRSNCQARSLVREALYVPETITVKALLQQFRASHRHLAIVMDEYGGTAGLVTLEDLIEEIIGEVSDPFDSGLPEIRPLADGSVEIDGLALIEEVNEALGLDLHEPSYDTIAGYFLGRLRRIPIVGDVAEADGIRLQVEAMDGMRISRLSLVRLKGKEPESDPEEAV